MVCGTIRFADLILFNRRLLMKTSSVVGKLFLAVVLVMGIYIGTAGAAPADFAVWNGSEWQITITDKGYGFNDPDAAPHGKVRGTTKVWGLMNIETAAEVPTGLITVTLYEAKHGDCVAIGDLVLNYLAGDSTAFVAESDPVASYAPIKGIFYFSGKLDVDVLNKGKVVTLGAYQASGVDPDPFEAFGINLTGTTKALQCTVLPPT
jgi:hypothetical protein